MAVAAARAWLPEPALHDGVLASRVERAVAAWAERWLAEAPPLRVSTLTEEAGVPNANGAGVRVTADREGRLHLAAALLGTPVPSKASPADRAVTDKLAGEAITALRGALEDQFRGDAGGTMPSTEPDLVFAVRLGETALARVTLARGAAIEARLRDVPATRPPTPLQDRARSLRDLPVRVGALAGHGRLGIGELGELGEGDVVVLDQGRDDVLPLTVDGRVAPEMACRPEERDGRLRLRVTSRNDRSDAEGSRA